LNDVELFGSIVELATLVHALYLILVVGVYDAHRVNSL